MFSFIGIVRSIIPPEYESLASKCRQNAQLKRNPNSLEKSYEPGDYNFDRAISFHLTHKLISSTVPEVFGSARQNNLIALTLSKSSNVDSRTVYVDAETQTFHVLHEAVAADSTVQVFRTTEIDPLLIFTNLQMQTTQVPSAKNDKGWNCSLDTAYVAGQCEAWYGINWNHGEDKPILKNTSLKGLQYRAGALGEAKAQARVLIKSLTNIGVDFDFDISATGGLGVVLTLKMLKSNLHLGEVTVPIFGYSITILGIKLEFGINAFLDFNLKKLGIEIADPMEYYRSITASLSKHGSVTTKDGLVMDPWKFKVEQHIENTFPHNISEFFERAQFVVEPEIKLGVKLGFSIGKVITSELRVGGALDMEWTFNANKEKCTFPYLYGTTQNSLYGFFEAEPLTVLGWHLIPVYKFNWPLWTGSLSPKHCIFSSSRSEEGISDLTFNYTYDSVVVKPTQIYPDPELGVGKDPSFSIRLDAYPHQQIQQSYQSIQLELIDFKPYDKTTHIPLSQMMILTNPPDSTQMKYQINSKSTSSVTSNVFGIESGEYELCSKYDNNNYGVCIETLVDATNDVASFKEFKLNQSQNLNYVSFQPQQIASNSNANDESIYGIITHGDGIQYKAPLSGFNAIDDSVTSTTNARKGEYSFGKQLKIRFNKIHQEATSKAVSADLWFYQCTDIKCDPIGRVSLGSIGHDFDSTHLLNDQGVILDLLKPHNLQIELRINTGSAVVVKQLTMPDYYFDGEEGNFTKFVNIENGKYEIYLDFSPNLPHVLFTLENPEVKQNGEFKGIIGRVFQPKNVWTSLGDKATTTFQMNLNEQYGILRFFFTSPDKISSAKFACIVEMSQEFVPLCDHLWLDKTHCLLTVQDGITSFSTLNQTHYFDNARTLNIPFRRNTNDTETKQISLTRVFISTKSGFCGENAEIEGFSLNGIDHGCVETKNPNSDFIQSWSINSDLPLTSRTVQDGEDWRVHLINLNSNSNADDIPEVKISMFKKYWEFPVNATSLAFTKDTVEDFVNHKDYITMHCDRCDALFFIHDGEMGGYAEKSENGIFKFKPETAEDLVFISECNDNNAAFCSVKQDFSEIGLALIEYPTPDGLNEASYIGIGSQLQGGFTRQIVYDRKVVKFYKSWKGVPKVIEANLKLSALSFKETKLENTILIEPYFGNVKVPFNINKFNQDPEHFFELVGVIKGDDGYNAEKLNMTDDGSIVINANYYKRPAQWDNNLVDIPMSFIDHTMNNEEGQQENNQPNKMDKKTLIIILSSVGAGIVLIALVVGIVVYRRKQMVNLLLSTTELIGQNSSI